MNFPNEAETKQWLEGLSAYDRDNEIILFCIFAAFGKPATYLDIGSGTGVMVNTAEKLGVSANGIDILPRPAHPKLLQMDLEAPIHLNQIYDLVSSIETAEHIYPQFADTLVDTITRHAKGIIVFTAAQPGQMGHGHVNCQPAIYWREKFYARGWDYNPMLTYRLVAMLNIAFHASHHVEANMQVFTPV